MAQPVEQRHYTPEEYFAIEERADYRSEYANGELFAMAGGTANHNRIAKNFVLALDPLFERKDCEAFMAEMRVQLQANRRYTYPDVVVVCGKLKFAQNRNDTITNPVVIIEVLSDSTEAYDRGSKFEDYRQIETFREYILVNQYRVYLETFVKAADGSWNMRAYHDLEADVPIASLNLTIPIQAIYRRVEFPTEPKLTRIKEQGADYGHDNQ